MRTIHLLATLLVLAAAPPLGGAPQAPPTPPAGDRPQAPLTFKVEVNYVEIDVTVTDQQGNPIADLAREDFHLTEEDRPQSVSVFSHIHIPVVRPDPPLFRATPVEPDVRTNRREFDGRVFVLLLDDLHTSFTRTPRVRAAAAQFIERHLGANDIAAVVQTSGMRATGQEFTGSQPLLLRAVNQFAGRRLPSEAAERVRSTGDARLSDAERAHRARNLLASVRQVAEHLTGIRGRRKAVVLFSEGIDYDVSNPIENQHGSDIMSDMRAAIAAATRGNVTFYAIDPRGLSGFEDAAEIGSLPADNPGALSALLSQARLAQDSLRTLAAETGGLAVVNRNDYGDAFDRIIRENSSYYVLGYYSDNTRRDGRFRPVEVRVRRPGLVVRARKGYVAPRGTPAAPRAAPAGAASPELREVLSSPLPVSALGLTASAAPFRGAGRQPSVMLVLEVDGSRFRFVEKDGREAAEIEMAAVPFDAAGNPRQGARDSIVITPRPETREAILTRGVRIVRRIEMPPGRYHLRVGARESGSGAAGSLMLDVEVPDFGKGTLVMSGIVLASKSASDTPTARLDDELRDVLQGPPTVAREFSRDDEVTVYAEIYDHVRTAHRVDIRTTVTADDGTVVYAHTDERGSDELRARGDGFGHVRTIPLREIAPGRYVLRIEARARVSGGGSAERELELTVR